MFIRVVALTNTTSVNISSLLNSLRLYPATIAAHPSEPNQFAVGLTDGGVDVLEPPGPEGKWGMSPPPENGAGPSVSSAPGSDQQPR